ncbi:tRNA glutamyl-Q(34) synthetase GluQRS [Spectribacter hydrogenoxidans]|uniref:Glutamyl-Q tRNA(Asp) synthetase n=1 Tax=Spectribacter hydrogenoxidans TaxID=3075608 RepID=A0ABU3BYC8_9GAMM|nr:tRNA glutamyl-Q(34) synthetase GluQRS [Salinisphaera sp. W335]MDT0634303.1 tRNA glutamyl-Q(34) synthetase GluQRS [Salinisphaera sp. W335]
MTDTEPVGRYAPSPSGPLHAGSLLAAVASFVHARSRGTRWVLRMDDIDRDREVPGAADDILRTLEAFGLTWDGPVLYQSRRLDAYQAALDQLRESGRVFDCGCTRREAQTGPAGIEGPVYPGTCRDGLPAGRSPRSVRFRTTEGDLAFQDGIQGAIAQNPAKDVGDFVVRRADGQFAYQLAVVVDDAAQGVTEVVRGADLLTSTPRQILLQQALGLPVPDYWHVPLIAHADGRKFSKSEGAAAIDPSRPVPGLLAALDRLGQSPPADLAAADVDTVLAWAKANWQIKNIPHQLSPTAETAHAS